MLNVPFSALFFFRPFSAPFFRPAPRGPPQRAENLNVPLSAPLSARQPDLRYEEGQLHQPGEEATTVLKLHNYGGSDAKNVTITASFPKPVVKPPRSNSDASPLKDISFSDGKTKITGTIGRIVPGQTVLIWYVIQDPGSAPAGGFVREIAYEGGTGQTGEPQLLKVLLWIWVGVTWLVNLLLLSIVIPRKVGAILKAAEDSAHKAVALLKKSLPLVEETRVRNEKLIQAMDLAVEAVEHLEQEKQRIEQQLADTQSQLAKATEKKPRTRTPKPKPGDESPPT
jgi:hypothetical protein